MAEFVSQSERLKFQNYVKVEFFKDLFVKNLPQFIHRVTISLKVVQMQHSKFYWPISTLTNTC